jgi:hypothetical protein
MVSNIEDNTLEIIQLYETVETLKAQVESLQKQILEMQKQQ